jgi:hypothetical protein
MNDPSVSPAARPQGLSVRFQGLAGGGLCGQQTRPQSRDAVRFGIARATIASPSERSSISTIAGCASKEKFGSTSHVMIGWIATIANADFLDIVSGDDSRRRSDGSAIIGG